MTAADHDQAVSNAHAAGMIAGMLHRSHGITPVPPAELHSGSLLMRKVATAWHAGVAGGRHAGRAETKDLAGGADGQLVGLLAGHEDRCARDGLGPDARPAAAAVLEVYQRGQAAWPGEVKALQPRDAWALGRVAAFLGQAAGETLPGYRRDTDLLPEGHPARTVT